MVRLIPQSVSNQWSAGWSSVKEGSKTLTRSLRSRAAGIISTTGSDNPISNAAELAVEALKNKTVLNGDVKQIVFDNGFDQYNEVSAKALLTNISIDLTLPDGTLNKRSILLNDSEAIKTLIDLSADKDLSLELRSEIKDLLAQLITKSAKQGGLLNNGYPDHIVNILRNHSYTEDTNAKVAKYQAAAQLITSLAIKNKNCLKIEETLNAFTNNISRYFHGEVAEQILPFVEDSLNEFLSNPQEIFLDLDLDIHPNVLRDFAKSLGSLFESGVTKPLRNDPLIQAAKDLISAYEVNDRNYGNHPNSSTGIETARKTFIDLWINQRVDLINQGREIERLKQLRESTRKGIENGISIRLDRDFCTAAEQAASPDSFLIIKPTYNHQLAIDERIRELELANQKATENFNQKMIAMKSSFENIASPFNNGQDGIKNLFFERLFGRDSEGEKITEQDFLDHFLSEYTNESLDYSQLTNPNYGQNFTGIKKLMLNRLQEIATGLQGEIDILTKHENELNTERATLDNQFWTPLATILPKDKYLEQAHVTQLESALRNFSKEEPKTSNAMNKVESLQKKSWDLIQHLIFTNPNDHQYSINEAVLSRETGHLNNHDLIQLKSSLQPIIDEMNKFYSDDKNKGKFFDWTHYSGQMNTILQILRSNITPIPSSKETPNSTLSLARLLFEENEAYHSTLISIAKVFQHEQSALDLLPSRLQTNVSTFENNLGLPTTSLDILITNNIASIAVRANDLRQLNSNNQALIERYTIMQTPTHSQFKEYWDQQSQRVKMDEVFFSTTKQDLINIGLDQRNARILQHAVDEYSEIFNIEDQSEFSFATIIDSFLKQLLSFLGNFGLITKDEQ